jgi:hypothetical protein
VAVKKATATIPIVFMGVTDPIATGLVESLARPGGNITGIINMAATLTGKRLALALPVHDNVSVKVSGACTLLHEPFPCKDIWDSLGRVFDAFGFDRCMWGTD